MAKKKQYLAFDCETGGLDPKQHSLLEIAFAVCDENLNVVDVLEMKLKDQATNATFKVTPGALAVNKIDLLKHNKESITYDEGRAKLLGFLTKHKDSKFIPIGHNINFDFGFVYEYLFDKPSFDQFVDYHARDTSLLGGYFKDMNIGPDGRKYSLNHWAEFLMIDIDPDTLHSALADTLLTIAVYKGMLELWGTRQNLTKM